MLAVVRNWRWAMPETFLPVFFALATVGAQGTVRVGVEWLREHREYLVRCAGQ